MDRISNESPTSALFVHSVDKNCNVNDYQRKSVSDLKQEQQREATKNTTTTSRESPEHCKGRRSVPSHNYIHSISLFGRPGKGFYVLRVQYNSDALDVEAKGLAAIFRVDVSLLRICETHR
jgi:hypothetical protein